MRIIKLLLAVILPAAVINLLLACKATNTIDAFCCAGDMRKQINESAELTPSQDVKAVWYDEFTDQQYQDINRSLQKFEKTNSLNVLRILVVFNGRCYFVARESSKEEHNLYLYSIGDSVDDCKLIGGAYPVDPRALRNLSDGGDFQFGTECDFSSILAYYYDGRIIVNNTEKVYECNIITGENRQFDANEYEYPIMPLTLSFSDDTFIVNTSQESYSLSKNDVLSSCREMKYLYDLSVQQGHAQAEEEFFSYIVYYENDVYVVCQPISKYGYSFGALFRFEPSEKAFQYIDCCFTNGKPYGLYPVRILSDY